MQFACCTGIPLTAFTCCCRGELGENITKLLEEVPRATSAPPHLQDRWGAVSGRPTVAVVPHHGLC
jgi:hypothetical protein